MADSLRDQNCIRQYSVDKCMICGATVSLKVCAKCKHVAYCSKDHQTQDWPVHKKQCKKLSKSGIAKTNDNGEQMGDFTKQLRHLSIDSGGGVSEVTSYTERENVGGTSEEQQTQSSDCQSKAVTSIFVNKGESICKRDMYDDGAPEVDNKSKCKNKRQHSTEEFQNFNDSDVFRNKSSESNNSATDTSEQEIGTGSSEQFILETEEASLHAPDYAAEKAKDTGSQSAMSYLSVVESRNKALSEYVMKCLNAYGVCVIDNFLGDCKGTDIFDEVQDMYEGGDLCSGQLVNTSSPKGSVRGDVTTWVDGSEVGCANVNFLISSIDAIMLHCQKSLGHYHIKGRSKAMVAVYPGHATHFLRHVDNPSGDGRCVTCIYYLNKNWNSKVDGGLLRIFPEGANRVANVEPKFDRLLFFWSDRRNPHEVLPAFRTRYAVTVWYYDEQERRKAVKRFKGRADAKTKEIVPLQALSMKNS